MPLKNKQEFLERNSLVQKGTVSQSKTKEERRYIIRCPETPWLTALARFFVLSRVN